MRLPAPLSRRDPNAHKNQFGHVLIVAGSERMLGAAALCGLAAMRSGAGLVTLGVAKSLNLTLHRKISPVIMTLPLAENSRRAISFSSYLKIKDMYPRIQSMAVGPGLGLDSSTRKLVLKIIQDCPCPLVIDADALNALAGDLKVLLDAQGPRVLTPHAGEMARLTGLSRPEIEKDRKATARAFAEKYRCVLLLKGHQTVIASADGRVHINRTGNPGMATAGSGDVLTGMIAAFLGQGIEPFKAAQTAAFVHGRAGDLAAEKITPISLMAQDILDFIPQVFHSNI